MNGRNFFLTILILGLIVATVTATTGAVDTVSIYEVQYTTDPGSPPDTCYPSSLLGDTVTVSGIVTAVDGYPPFSQIYIAEEPGGEFRGICCKYTSELLREGDSLTVTGLVEESSGMTILNIISLTKHSSEHALPGTLFVSTADLPGECDFFAEACEAGLVMVQNVVVTKSPDVSNQWGVTDTSGEECLVDCVIFDVFNPDNRCSCRPQLGDSVRSVTGIVIYKGGEYTVNPRRCEDVICPHDSNTTICDVQAFDERGENPDCYPSPLEGQTVTLTGIVTAVKSGQYPNFFLQQTDTACGVFFYQDEVSPERGDSLTVTAAVDEYYGMTEMKNVSDFIIHSHDCPFDTLVISNWTLAGGCSARAEVYEGLLVRVNDVVVTQEADQYGQWYVADTSGVECQIEDFLFHYEPSVGDICLYIIGVVTYGYGEYEISPRDGDDIGCEIVIPPCTPISEIQFSTDAGTGDECYPSQWKDSLVTLCGVVTGVTTNTEDDNFWLQDSDSRWSGIFVFDNTIHPDRGDSLKVTGTIDEHYGLTELKNIIFWERRATQMLEPEPLLVTAADLADGCLDTTRESYEGVLIRINDVVVTQAPDEHGEWYVSDDGGANECQIDDLCFHYEAEVGESLGHITGVVHYSYEEYEINPRDTSDLTSVELWDDWPQIPMFFSLSQNYPNPFNPVTQITFSVPMKGEVRLSVYNIVGQKVAELVNGKLDAGSYRVGWNAKSFTSGVYFYKIEAGNYQMTRKMVFLK